MIRKVAFFGDIEHRSIKGLAEKLCLDIYAPFLNQCLYDEETPDIVFSDHHFFVNPQIRSKVLKFVDGEHVIVFVEDEAVEPDFNLFDYAFVYDAKSFGKDRAFPKLRETSKWKNETLINTLSEEEAERIIKDKRQFCCFQYSNPRAHEMRDKLFYEISIYKKVDAIGPHLNNIGNITTRFDDNWMEKSIQEKANYKFSIAVENAVLRGYNSEKIQNSFLAHTIPIYFGDPDIKEVFNQKSFINVCDYPSFDELREAIEEIDCNATKYKAMLLEPWQTDEQILSYRTQKDKYQDFMSHIFTAPIKELIRRPIGTWRERYLDEYMKMTTNVPKGKPGLVRRACRIIAYEGMAGLFEHIIKRDN